MAQERDNEWQQADSPATLVRDLIEKGIDDKRLLDAFTQIRRADFIPQEFVSDAYRDEPVDIGHHQVTTQPSLIAVMVQALRLTGTEKVLEIGTGFGFQTAILSRLCQQVFSIERLADLATMAESNLRKAGIQNATVVVGDGTFGLPEHAPFEAIIVSAAAPNVPQPLVDQLKEGGRLVQPIGPGGGETVTSFQKIQGTLVEKEDITGAYFVPLLGAFGVRKT
jgi:protein-L-isoaspartate(D-aspartate) O-methyltransferase